MGHKKTIKLQHFATNPKHTTSSHGHSGLLLRPSDIQKQNEFKWASDRVVTHGNPEPNQPTERATHLVSIRKSLFPGRPKLHINKWKNSHYPNGYYVNLFMFSTFPRARSRAMMQSQPNDFPHKTWLDSYIQFEMSFHSIFAIHVLPRGANRVICICCWLASPLYYVVVAILPNALGWYVCLKKWSHKLPFAIWEGQVVSRMRWHWHTLVWVWLWFAE